MLGMKSFKRSNSAIIAFARETRRNIVWPHWLFSAKKSAAAMFWQLWNYLYFKNNNKKGAEKNQLISIEEWRYNKQPSTGQPEWRFQPIPPDVVMKPKLKSRIPMLGRRLNSNFRSPSVWYFLPTLLIFSTSFAFHECWSNPIIHVESNSKPSGGQWRLYQLIGPTPVPFHRPIQTSIVKELGQCWSAVAGRAKSHGQSLTSLICSRTVWY
jgi:hypothetical protein